MRTATAVTLRCMFRGQRRARLSGSTIAMNHPLLVGSVALAATLTSARLGAQSTTRVDVTATGQQLPNGAIWPAIAANGRFVAFVADDAANLVPGDTNGTTDVFVKDLVTGGVVRASLTATGVQGNGPCFQPKLSADGSVVAFSSWSTNLAASDANGTLADIFVKNLTTGALEHVSRTSAGAGGNDLSVEEEISADGRFVIFESYATNFVANDTNGQPDIFVFDRQTQSIECVSVDPNGVPLFGLGGSISGDGRYVAFETLAAAIGSTQIGHLVAIRDRVTGVVTAANQLPNGDVRDGDSAVISSDASTVVFRTAWSLVAADADGGTDLYAFDRATGARTLVTPSIGAPSNQDVAGSGISADGRFVTFSSDEAFDTGDTNGIMDAYVVDRVTGTIERLSKSLNGGVADDRTSPWGITSNGRFVVLLGKATNLVANDTNATYDVFVRDRCAPAVTQSYGSGFPGTGGIAPQLSLLGAAAIGTTPSVTLTNPSNTSTLALVILGLQQQAAPHPAGGTLLATLDAADLYAVPAAGLSFPTPVPDIVDLCGIDLHLQALVLDAGATAGIAFSQGLRVTIGG